MSGSLSRLYLTCMLCLPVVAQAALHHVLEVSLDPERGYLEVTDTLSVTDAPGGVLEFALHPGLQPEALTPGARLIKLTPPPDRQPQGTDGEPAPAVVRPVYYRVILPPGLERFVLRYQGKVHHALRTQGEEYARGFRETAGTVSNQGVYLAGQSYWYPHFRDGLMTFELDLRLPAGWAAMTQGERLGRDVEAVSVREQWRCTTPQEEIYLMAGEFTEYSSASNGVLAMVLLRTPDAALAQRYLEATELYLRLYSTLLGPYPYTKFALVENFWETGYGMPSFTLLGPKVIRFPFILHSSYPHEILHNWWGNGVYVDYARGTWAEGLSSYLADHLVKEQRGQGVNYRRTALQKYTDQVRTRQDFPLTAFRVRHSAASEAVGYGKTLMLFHMLRQRLGDASFTRGLQELYRQYLYRVADFAAVEAVFSAVSGESLEGFFAQWVQRAGAPRLQVSEARARPQGEGYRLTAQIEQDGDTAPYRLRVPVAVALEGEPQAYQTDVLLEGRRTTLELELPARPWRLEVDPQFDVFRRLHRNEIPPALSQALGAEQLLIVLPAAAPQPLREAYAALAGAWREGNPEGIEVVLDDALEQLPESHGVWLFGWENRFRDRLARALNDARYTDQGDSVTIEATRLQRDEHSVVVMARHPANPEQALGWLASDTVAAFAGLGRKLPHYGKYSYLAFTGPAPTNVFKGQWPVVDSPMSVRVVQEDGVAVATGEMHLALRQPLIQAPAVFSTDRMQRDIALLADTSLQGRGLGTPELERAADYIATQFRAAGLQPGGTDGTYFQVWEQRVEELERTVSLKNVVAVLPGTAAGRAAESLVIGAHYDHLGRGEYAGHAEHRGEVHPGADDNASGIAVLLELARALAGKPQPRSIVFVAFTGEEAGRLGSRHYVRQATHYPPEKTIAMLNLDTIGRLGDRPLTVFGSGTAAEWGHILRGTGYVTGIQLRAVPDDIGSSDQTSFIAAGVPAVQLFSGVHGDYHRPGDIPGRIDVEGLVKTARVLKEMADYLASRPEALTSTPGAAQQLATAPEPAGRRQVSLGTVPDYAWSGKGVRIDGVREGTPAAAAGLQPGDIILEINTTGVTGLRDYARALRQLNPGDVARVRFRRNGDVHLISTRVVVR